MNGADSVNFIDALKFIGDNAHLLWTKSLEQIGVSLAAVAISIVLAIPLGIYLGHKHRFSFLAINVANVGRALPSLAVVSIGLALLGIGFWNVCVALIVLAFPPMLTNAYVGVDGVDTDTVDAARGMGMREREILWKVELPLALPLIFAGIRTAALYAVSTATLAGVAGGGGLGEIINDQTTYRFRGVLGAAICVALLALLFELAFALLQRAVTPRGLKEGAREPSFVGPPDTAVQASSA